MVKRVDQYHKFLDLPNESKGQRYPIHFFLDKHYHVEVLKHPEIQKTYKQGLYYESKAKRQYQKNDKVRDIMNRIIIPGEDIIIAPNMINKPYLHTWKVVRWSKENVIAQCLTPGYEIYRAKFHCKQVLVITDQIWFNASNKD